ncbi:MAG: hypothetical protein CSA62_08870 [Planctomycetota bacterium]|nr:MAG: hypothetical protein CSA62_08870 [Planctomycetota bacterium]
MSTVVSRSRVLILLLGAGALLLVARLAYLQLGHSEVWAERRRHNLKGFQWVPGMRGSILDRRGQVLAKDVPEFTLQLRYRDFRKGQVVALMVDLDRFVRRLHQDPYLPSPPRPAGEEALRYSDFQNRFGQALQRIASWPARWLHKKGPLDGWLLSTMRFYVMELVRLAIDSSREEFPSQVKLGLRFDALHAEPSREPVFDVLAEVFRRGQGRAGGNALFQEVFAGVLRGHRQLLALESRLGARVLLRGPNVAKGQRGRLSEFLDSLDAYHARLAKKLIEQDAERVKQRADQRFAGLRKFFGLWSPAVLRSVEDGDFTTEELLRWRFRAEELPLTVQSPVDFESCASWLAVRNETLPGFQVGETVDRKYPVHPVGSDRYSFIGVVSRFSAKNDRDKQSGIHRQEQDLARVRQLLRVEEEDWKYLLGWRGKFAHSVLRSAKRQGRSGIEYALNEQLSGRGGLRALMQDRRGRELSSEQFSEATRGFDVQLALDTRLQDLANAALARYYVPDKRTRPKRYRWLERVAGLALVDVDSGDILALASTPKKIRKFDTGELVPVWGNYALRKGYNPLPGSVMKPIFAAYAMRFGMGFDQDFASCSSVGHKHYASDRRGEYIDCHPHREGGPGQELEEAISASCNVYFGQLAEALGQEGVFEALESFGFLSHDGGASKWKILGLQPSPSNLPLQSNRKRSLPILSAQGLGYGLHTTPLALARAYAGLATGRLPQLRFVTRVGGRELRQKPGRSLGISDEALRRIHEGLRRVTRHGTARGVFSGLRIEVVGKTGTPEILSEHADPNYRNNAVFCGFAPLRSPRIAFAVMYHVVPHKSFQGSRAALAIRDLLAAMESDPELRRLYLEPR